MDSVSGIAGVFCGEGLDNSALLLGTTGTGRALSPYGKVTPLEALRAERP
jgi:hypothetical protein